jgi:ABC-2 type transport system ATP-binding protein
MEPVVQITNLRKVYGSVVAADGVSLRAERGEVFGILGPNGAGKSTTVECAAGLRRPDSGTVRVLGLDPATDPEAVRQRVGVQLQHAVLPDRMKVKEAMAVFAAAYRKCGDSAGVRGAGAG